MVWKPASIAIAARLTLNVHDLNNEAVAGNVTDIRLMDFITADNETFTAPAVSGRMLKHFHLTHMTDLELREGQPKLCAGCRVKEPIRPGILSSKGIAQNTKIRERDAIESCVVCDTHGYLIAAGGIASRRMSRAMFAWLVPVIETEYVSKQVLHSRVSRQITMEAPQISQTEGEEAKVTEQQLRAQMLFNKSYASGTYSFVSALDLKGIGYVEGEGNQVLSADEWKRRAEMAVKAYIPMLTGNMGASLSHAIPHVDCVELILAVSAEKPIMIPFSPMYKGYGQKYMGLLGTRDDVNVYTYGIDIAGAIRKEKLSELFEDVINTIRAAE